MTFLPAARAGLAIDTYRLGSRLERRVEPGAGLHPGLGFDRPYQALVVASRIFAPLRGSNRWPDSKPRRASHSTDPAPIRVTSLTCSAVATIPVSRFRFDRFALSSDFLNFLKSPIFSILSTNSFNLYLPYFIAYLCILSKMKHPSLRKFHHLKFFEKNSFPTNRTYL